MKQIFTISNQLTAKLKRLAMVLTMLLIVGIGQAWGADYELVTSAPSDWSGEYLIVAGTSALSGGTSSWGTTTTVTVNNNKISTEANISVTISKGGTSGTYYIYMNSNSKYLKEVTSNTFATADASSADTEWKISLSNGNAQIACASATTRYLRLNGTSGYRCYTSATGTLPKLYKKAASHTITAQSNNTTYGTVSLSGTTITATPKTGYRVSTTTPYTISPSGSATITQNGNTFTVTPSANTTITINFEALPKYTVTLMDDESTLTQSTAGGSVTLPSRDGCDGYEFVGWTKSWSVAQTTWTTTAPTIIPDGSYTPTANENLYPVYTKTETTQGTPTTTSKTYSHTITAKTWSANGAQTLNNVSWTLTNDGNYYGYDGTKGQQVGSGSSPAKSMTLTTSGFSSATKITAVRISTSGASSISGSVGVTVGSTAFKSGTATTKSLSSTNTEYEFTGSSSGNVTISWSQTSSKAIYFKAIEVDYQTTTGGGNTTTTSYISVPDCTIETAVTLNPNGGTIGDSNWKLENGVYKLTTEDESINLPTITRTGYTFGGWATSSGGSYGANAIIPLDGTPVTLYAIWTANTYNITYKDQGNAAFSGTHDTGYPTQHTYGTETTLKGATKIGYTFEGWYKDAACTNKVTTLGATEYTSAITLYAKWTAKALTNYRTFCDVVCDAYSFHTGTGERENWLKEAIKCFTEAEGGYEHEWQIKDYIIPADDKFFVGNYGYFYNDNLGIGGTNGKSRSVVSDWGNMYLAPAMDENDAAGTPRLGHAKGAKGTLRIFEDSNWDNLYVGFIPDGYKLKFGNEEYTLAKTIGTEYRSDVVQYNSTNADKNVSVGVVGADGKYVATNHTQEMRHIFLKDNCGWRNDGAKLAIYYWGDSEGWCGFLKTVPGDETLFEGWIPSNVTNLKFVRFSDTKGSVGNWDDKWNETGDLAITTEQNLFTMTEFSNGTWSAYERYGQFAMHDNSKSKNWYVHFVPHYVLTYDKNATDATGEMDVQTVAVDADDKKVVVANCKFTRPGYRFIKWRKGTTSTSYVPNGSNSIELNADITLYAVWEKEYTVTYNADGGTTSCVDNNAYIKGETVTVCNKVPTKTGHTFLGWSYGNNTYTAGATFTMPANNVILTAQWQINQYTVTLNPNYPAGKTGTFTYEEGELVDGNLVFTYDYNTTSKTIEELYTSLTLDGYDFGGWYNAKGSNPGEVSGSKCTTTGDITGNKTYFAKWSKLYTITLSENGTTTTPTTQTSTSYTLPTELTAGSCQDDTKELVGWSKVAIPNPGDKPTSNFYELGETVTLTEDQTTFYAVFAKVEGGGGSITWKETFDTNKGTGGNDGQWSGAIASSDLLSDHTWSFYNAKGANKCAKFASNSNGGSATTPEIDCGSSTDATLTFKAGSWKDDKTILSIMATNCTIDLSSVNLPDQKWEEYTINITNIIGKIKITFSSETKKRFFLDEVEITSSGGTSYSDYITLCDNSKVWAKYDLNGGTGASACTQTLVTKDAPFNLCSETPTKDGYTFNGWSDGTKTYAAGAEVIISKTTTFYATWKANTITITWDLNYADSPEAATSEYVYDGDEIEMPADPTRTGYTFTGWYTTSTGGTEITEVGEENKPTSDVTYYAHWLELYTVTYMASGQVYVKQEYKYLSGDKLQLPENDPTAANFACDGYLFEGWSKYPQTKEDAKCPELVDANTSVENDLELHAVWKKASTSGAGTQSFYESFDTENGTGGNDGKWSGDIAKNSKVNTTWTFENEGGADQCIKLGSGSKKGSATTPALTQLSGDATLSFKAAAWNSNSESTILKLSISGGGTLTQTSVTLVKGAWTTYEVQIKDGTPSSKITFEAANASNNRFFLDEVMITTSGSYNYTTSPSCGPTMVAKENVWGTSANGQSVKVNVPIGVKMFEGKATVTGTSTNENFVVNTLENVGNGEHNVVVVYTPTAEDIKENTTITLTAKNGEEIWSTTTFTLHGRSLPAEFVVVANKGDKNYALPANMPEAGTYAGFEVQVNGDEVIAAPKSHLYNLCAVHSTRYGENGTAVRLVGNDNACLWASSAAKSTDIRNWAKTDNAKATNYEWSLYTEDGDTYRISSTAVTEEGRVLRYNGEKFGMYKEGTDVLRLLPVGCSSTPLNVQVSPARISAIVSWTNAGACELVVKQGGVTVVTLPSATSPAQVSNLAESTAYTFTLIPNDDASCGVSGAFTTTGPSIDIVEWQMEGIRIQVDKDEDVNPIIIINGEEEHGDVGGQVATELFFSKYYEAHAENKLLAVYNGTTQTIDLNGYVIKHGTIEIDLSQYGQTKGFIASNEEIIFVSFDTDVNKSAESCAEKEEGFSSWNVLGTSDLAFSGRGSVGLYKNDVLIDLIGSTYPSGELTKIGKAGKPDYCGTGDDVQLYVDGVSVNDQSSFFCHNGDNIKTPEVETDYPISTNRCLLIRKNSVTSGADAVASNKAVDGAKCGELSSTFATLCSEWGGFRIGSGRSSDDEIQDATCEGLGYVGGFDYNNYYRTMETIFEGTELDNYEKNPDDNTYFIEFEVSEYACLNIQLQLTDDNGNVLTDQITQVPILVYDKKTTTDELFSAIVKDGETPDYENSKIRCATCDVVILDGATLTKAAPETPNDVNQVRDIYVYPGGKLVIPEGATDYSVNSVSLRRNQDSVSMADIQTPLNITSSSKTPVYVDVRINSKNWHWLSLPYNCNIADVTWKNGSKALYNSDWFLMYYDGESRVNEQSHYENHWKLFEGTTIEAGKGYIVGITGHATKSGVQYELRFPMAAEVLTHEKKDKTVAVNAWGVNMDVTPNKKGWNLVGNPYLDYYQPSTGGFAGLSLIKYTNMDPVTGEWHYDNSGDVPFIVTPVDGGWYEYRQDLASEVDMKPFTSYFVQVGQPGIHEDDDDLSASFTHSQRGRSSLIRRAPQEVNEVEEPIIVGVELTNSKGESDKTTLIIDDRFTSDYEMNADFFKWFGDYYKYYTKPVLYSVGADAGKRAFNALSEQLAAQPVALGMFAAQAGDYTFTLTRKRCDLSRVEEVWLYDATTATYTNLMQQDYTFTTAKTEGEGRFYLSVKLRQNAPTDITDIYGGNIVASAKDGQIIVGGLTDNTQLWIYDATGKLLHTEQTTNFQHVYEAPVAGTYFVRTQVAGQSQTIKVLVE